MSRIDNYSTINGNKFGPRERIYGFLPCPFCGLKPFLQKIEYKVSDHNATNFRYSLVCCLYMTAPILEDKEQVVRILRKKWNRRAYNKL